MSHWAYAILAAVQLLATCAAFWIIFFDIWLFPVVSVGIACVGVCTARGRYYHHSPPLLVLGVSPLVLTLLDFLWIFLFDPSPLDSQRPLSQVMLAYLFAIVPVGLVAIYGVIRSEAALPKPQGWQFRVRSLLYLMASVALALAGYRIGHAATHETLGTIAMASPLVTALAIALVWVVAVIQPHEYRDPLPELDEDRWN